MDRDMRERLAALERLLQETRDSHEQASQARAREDALRLREAADAKTLIEQLALQLEMLRLETGQWAAQAHDRLGELHTAVSRIPRSVYIGEDTVLTRSAYGHIMTIDSRDRSLSPHIALGGAWEDWIVREMRRFLKPGMTAVDVGANCGVFSLVMCDDVGPAGHVHCFEPDSRSANMLSWNLLLNGFSGRFTLHRTALGADSGETTLNTLVRLRGDSSLQATASPPGVEDETVTAQRVPLARLDDVLGGAANVDVLKIDAEGSEFAILQGASGLLQRSQAITLLLEVDDNKPGRRPQLDAMLADLSERGFKFYDLDPVRGRSPFTASDLDGRWHELLVLRGEPPA